MLRFVGDGDQKKITKNPRRFSMQNFWRAGKVTIILRFHEDLSYSASLSASMFNHTATVWCISDQSQAKALRISGQCFIERNSRKAHVTSSYSSLETPEFQSSFTMAGTTARVSS